MSTKKKNHVPMDLDENSHMGAELSFAASEAYKLLRTNLIFSFPKEDECRVIGITSSIRGEGKSTTALNLAYALAEADKKVLLMELDMRLPTVARCLSLAQRPGLSNFLVGLNKVAEVLQKSGIHENLSVITAGDIPPNPSELLESKEMDMMIDILKKSFDFILLDLPPVNAVSDALIVSKLTNGMVMVVRQNYSNSRELNEAMRQMKIVDAKILGFVMNAGETHKDKYGKKKYKKYGYEYGYEYSCESGKND
ncbi:MAG: CpsD/CapB family tyrosine-protein kinase [Eubacteriales bacterium]|nr:CpsD/CapB family tyrosine-protein kinase [Eubacteriales bacterium]